MVPPGAFLPPPRVQSAVITVDLTPGTKVPDPLEREHLIHVIKSAFAKRRKTLVNSLSGSGYPKAECRAALEALGWPPTQRGETLSFSEFQELAKGLRPVI